MPVIGTAGHIDHGKTALVRALTGIDTDRLPEEKARGITIELGFAHLELDGLRCGVIDVPGHERFIRAMVAGATGIDVVLLVVAADEGVMPQTREHVDVVSMLGVSRGVVALSKCDLADAEQRALAEADVREALLGGPLAQARVIPVSAHSGEGLDQLRAELGRLLRAAPERDAGGLFRLPLDRVFTIKGFGTVVTGTVAGGSARVGDELVVLPGGRAARVRGAQVHGAAVAEVVAGQRAALNLTGVTREEIARGDVLAHAGLTPAQVVDARVGLLASCREPLRSRARVLAHAGTAQVMATVVLAGGRELLPGQTGSAQLRLERPLALLPDDRFILRGFRPQLHHGTTLGGGTVARLRPPRLRRAGEQATAAIERYAGAGLRERVLLEVRAAGRAGVAVADLPARVGAAPGALREALAQRDAELLELGGLLLHAETFAALGEAAAAAVRDHDGLAREELRARLGVDARVCDALVADGVRAGLLSADRERVELRGAAPRLTPEAARALQVLEGHGLTPPGPPDARICAELVRAGRAVRLKDLLFARSAIDALHGRLRAFLAEKGQITPQEWKDLVGASRKYAIPLAEYFDAEKVTLRVGEVRKLRGQNK